MESLDDLKARLSALKANYYEKLQTPHSGSSAVDPVTGQPISVIERGLAVQLKYRPDLAVPERFQYMIGYQGQGYSQSGQASNFADQLQATTPVMRNVLKQVTPALFQYVPSASDRLKFVNQTNPSLNYNQAGGAVGASDYLVQGPAVGTESKYNDPAYNTPPHNLVQRGEIKEVDGKLVIPSDRTLTYFNGRKDYNMWNYGEVLRGLSPRGQDLFKLAIMDTQMPHLSKLGGVLNDSVQLQQMRDVLAMRLKTADRLPQISERFNLNIPAGSYPIFTEGKSGVDSGYEEYMPDSIREGGPLAWENGQQSRTNSTSLYMQHHQSWPQFMVGYVGSDGVEHRFEDGGAVMVDKKGNLTKLSQEEYAVAHGGALHLQSGDPWGLSNYDFGVWHIEPNVPIDSGPAGAGNPGINTFPADFDVKRLHAAIEYLTGELHLPAGTIALFKPGSRDTLIGYINTSGQTLFDKPVTLQVAPALTSAQQDEARKAMLNPANADANLSTLS